MYKEYLMPAIAAFAISAASGPFIIPALMRLKAGQTVRDDGPQSHQVKNGTPTIGGLIIMLGYIAACVIFSLLGDESEGTVFVAAAVIGFGIIGFIDDYIKVVLKRSLGLRAWQKFLLQTILTVGLIVYGIKTEAFTTEIQIPFMFDTVDLGVFYYFFVAIVVLGTVNGANFTDGLDGLATKVTSVIAVFLLIVGISVNTATLSSSAMIGALLGFLLFNSHKASVFMGDTGSLALGGYVAATAMLLQIPVYIIIIAFIYFAEVLSVILQVGYFKITKGKRIFKMAPIHHHFELCGYPETKVVSGFTIVTIVLCALALMLLH